MLVDEPNGDVSPTTGPENILRHLHGFRMWSILCFRARPTRMNLPQDQTATTSLYGRLQPQHICGVVLRSCRLARRYLEFQPQSNRAQRVRLEILLGPAEWPRRSKDCRLRYRENRRRMSRSLSQPVVAVATDSLPWVQCSYMQGNHS